MSRVSSLLCHHCLPVVGLNISNDPVSLSSSSAESVHLATASQLWLCPRVLMQVGAKAPDVRVNDAVGELERVKGRVLVTDGRREEEVEEGEG